MATPGRRPDPPLERDLFERPYRFGFFQAVRLLRLLRPGGAPVGHAGPPRREVARFRTHQSLAFPPSELCAVSRPDGEAAAPTEVTVAFMGLTGPLGVLPYCYTEMLIERGRAGDRTAAAFLDLFNHRLISLFFRAWEKYRPYLAYEQGERDAPSARLYDLIGLGLDPLRRRNAFPDEALRFHAGAFARRRRPAVVLRQLLGDYFGLPVEVCQFAGQWLRLEPADRSRLGGGPDAHNGLGTTLVVGTRVWDEQGKFRLRIGPLTLDRFLALSPGGADFRALVQMTRMFVDAEFAFDVQLVLAADEVPACRLTRDAKPGPRLGRHAWLKSRPFTKDSEDAVFPAGV